MNKEVSHIQGEKHGKGDEHRGPGERQLLDAQWKVSAQDLWKRKTNTELQDIFKCYKKIFFYK